MSPLTLWLGGWAAMALVMAALWLEQRRRKDASLVDVAWTAGLGALALVFAALAGGDPGRRGALAAAALLWSARLAVHLVRDRIIGKPEDGRYRALREQWGERAQPYFFLFFQAQAGFDAAFALSFLAVAVNPRPLGGGFDLAALGIWLAAVAGESAADASLARFRANPANRGRSCRDGLWRFSRHPNYFFEWLHWWSYVLLAVGSPLFGLSLVTPALLLFLLFRVTGIPATEAQAVKSRGEDYREYQRTTSAFFPLAAAPDEERQAMTAIEAAEKGVLPDAVVRLGIRRLLRARLREERHPDRAAALAARRAFLAGMGRGPIAPVPELANQQHYELPPAFFRLVLGPRLKYSSCLFAPGETDLGRAEEAMLALSCERAALADGMDILELGCGWGSLTLWMAERFPRARIVAVSNSRPQGAHIALECGRRGLGNVTVHTADMNDFAPAGSFNRVVSVEMIEHMRNWEALLARIASWLRPEGSLFVHHFAHRERVYAFAADGDDNWMGRHFFSGGIMPSEDLLLHLQRDLVVEETWRVSGSHYAMTAEAWLANLDRRRDEVRQVLEVLVGRSAGEDADRLGQRWRMFFLACAELLGFAGGEEWGVQHVRMTRRAAKGAA